MRHLGLTGLAVALTIAALTAGGCCKKEKEELAALQGQYNELSIKNREIQSELAAAKAREMDLQAKLAQAAQKDSLIASKDREIISLQAKLKAQAAAAASTPKQPAGWDVGKYADKITVGSDILFASGKAKLTANGKAALAKIVSTLRSNYAGMRVRVYGYTDGDPIRRTKNLWQDNLDLSANRAMAVTRYLTSKGIKADNIETVAMGATNFVARNNSAANKAKNRRVEIVVIKR